MAKVSAEKLIEKMSDKEFQEQKIKDLEDKIRAGEEAALKRVCAAMGISEDSIKDKEKEQAEVKMVRCWVSFPIRINQKEYLGDVTVPYETFKTLQYAMSSRRQRLLHELTGNNYILKALEGGGFAPQLIGQVTMNEAGPR